MNLGCFFCVDCDLRNFKQVGIEKEILVCSRRSYQDETASHYFEFDHCGIIFAIT